MKNILVPVDFSKYSKAAVDHAISMAKGTNTGLHLVHVFEFDLHFNAAFPEFQSAMTAEAARIQADYSPERQLQELREDAEERLDKIKELAKDSGLMVHTEIIPGRAHKGIIQYAKDNSIDLIIMGTHGATGMEELFWGSNAQRVVRLAPCPVMTVKTTTNEVKLDDILVVSDFSDDTAKANIGSIRELQDYMGGKVRFLYVNTPSEFETTSEIKKKIVGFLENHGYSEDDLIIHDEVTVEDGVVDFCEDESPDLVVVTTHGRKGLRRLIKGNLAEVLVNHLTMPVLTYHSDDD